MNSPKTFLAVKVLFTLFMAVLVPFYWAQYGPLNFLYFCDLALFLALAALWLKSSLLASMAAVAITLPQAFWVADFLLRLCTGMHIPGESTAYMFDPEKPLFVRALSSFHGWLPFLLLWLVWRFGYDRRALPAMTVFCWLILILSYALVPSNDPTRAGNVNKVFGWGDADTAPPMAPLLWLGVLMLGFPVLVYVPTHFVLCWLAPPRRIASETAH